MESNSVGLSNEKKMKVSFPFSFYSSRKKWASNNKTSIIILQSLEESGQCGSWKAFNVTTFQFFSDVNYTYIATHFSALYMATSYLLRRRCIVYIQ